MLSFRGNPKFSLRELQVEMDALENGPISDLTDEDIKNKASDIYDQFMEQIVELPCGETLCRAVKVNARPSEVRRLSYSPKEYIVKNGRLNRSGESVFYCASHPVTSLYECRPQVGDLFAVSAWVLTKALRLAHLGFSMEVAQGARVKPFDIHPEETQRNRLIREWQGRVFTKAVEDGQEDIYRLPIALKEMAMCPRENAKPVSGVIYPSIALGLMADNVALTPTAVDDQLTLFEVHLTRIVSMGRKHLPGGMLEYRMGMHLQDVARSTPDGTLVWGQKSQTRISNKESSGLESRTQPRTKKVVPVLSPNYVELCDWATNRRVDQVRIKTGADWEVRMW